MRQKKVICNLQRNAFMIITVTEFYGGNDNAIEKPLGNQRTMQFHVMKCTMIMSGIKNLY